VKLFEAFDIPVYMDISLPLIAVVFILIELFTQGIVAALTISYILVAIYFLVVIHEFAHSLTGAYYGYPTKKITLFALGGAAEMEMEEMSPKELIIMALAGPLSNLVLAIVLVSFLLLTNIFAILRIQEFVQTLVGFNIVMAIFNLLPVFPMDGGRVLHALLYKATGNMERVGTICLSVTYTVSGMGAVAGVVYGHFMLVLVAIFLVIVAKQAIEQVSYCGR
jgi:Zn-dependent protease